jgi:formylglycine-generating enzyme required for sulfatase activity
MHGSVKEWCEDWYDRDYYARPGKKDPQGPDKGQFRVIRGGSWLDDGLSCRAAFRDGCSPSYQINYLGFRVAAVLSK